MFVLLVTLVAGLSDAYAAGPPPAKPNEPPVGVISRHSLVGSESISGPLRTDSEARVLYVPRGTYVDVLDLDSGANVGKVSPVSAAAAIAIARPLQRGFIVNRGSGKISVFDLKSFAIVATGAAGGNNPSAIEFDADTGRLFIAHADHSDVVILDAKTLRQQARIAVGGTPRQLVSNEYGRIFVTIEDRNLVHLIDSRGLRSLGSFPLFGGLRPDGIGIDPINRRLYVANGNGKLIVLDSDIGFLLADLPIAPGPSSVSVDVTPVPGKEIEAPAVIHAYVGSATGPMTVVRMVRFDTFAVMQSLDLERPSRWLTVDRGRHRVLSAGGDSGPLQVTVSGR